jgi:hypothetical protein
MNPKTPLESVTDTLHSILDRIQDDDQTASELAQAIKTISGGNLYDGYDINDDDSDQNSDM